MNTKASRVKVIVTDHAIDRYRERIGPCTRSEAVEQVKHAVQIAKAATRHQRCVVRALSLDDYPDHFCLYCPVESFALFCRRAREGGGIVVKTVFRCPTPEEAERNHRERTRRLKRGNKARRRLCSEIEV